MTTSGALLRMNEIPVDVPENPPPIMVRPMRRPGVAAVVCSSPRNVAKGPASLLPEVSHTCPLLPAP